MEIARLSSNAVQRIKSLQVLQDRQTHEQEQLFYSKNQLFHSNSDL